MHAKQQEEEAAKAAAQKQAEEEAAAEAAKPKPLPPPRPPPPRPAVPVTGVGGGASPLQAPPEFADLETEIDWRVEAAELSKGEGNEAFRIGDALTALRCYGRALALLGRPTVRPQLRRAVDVSEDGDSGSGGGGGGGGDSGSGGGGGGGGDSGSGGGGSGGAREAAAVAAHEAALLIPAVERELISKLRQRGLALLSSLHCNCCAALLSTGRPSEAYAAASAALVLSPSDVKARRRRAAASTALGRHRAACDDLSAAWKVKRTADLAADLAQAWAERAPPLHELVGELTGAAGAAAALVDALIGGGKPRQWVERHSKGSGAAALAGMRQMTALLDAAVMLACHPFEPDSEGAVAALRATAWALGTTGLHFEREIDLTNKLSKMFDALVAADSEVRARAPCRQRAPCT